MSKSNVDSASGRKVMTRRPNGEYAEQGLRSPTLALGWAGELSSAGGMMCSLAETLGSMDPRIALATYFSKDAS